jgi:putative DNA primase/helicase
MTDQDPAAVEVLAALAQIVEADALVLSSPSDPMAVAREYVAQHYTRDDVLLLRRQSGSFYAYDGTCWPELDDADLRSRVYKWTEAAFYRKEGQLVPWQPTRYKIDNVFDALRAVAHLGSTATPPTWIDIDGEVAASELVAMGNGLLHLPTRKLYAHSPTFWVHHALAFDYARPAPQPRHWLRFLAELWEDDDDSIGTLQELFGYVLSGATRLQKMFLIVGPKRSGKGTIGRVLTGLLGRHNVAAPTLSGMTTDFGLAPLIDKPLALISDARLSDKRDSSLVVERLLSISGEDTLTINRKYKDHWTGQLPSRFVILTNELPSLSDSSGAFASRFVVLKLTTSFYGREDQLLTDKLLEEATGIFTWALEGLDRLTERGYFLQPASAQETVDELLDLASPIAMFVRERCVLGPEHEIAVERLFRAWRSWCEDKGYDRPGSVQTFGRDLRAVIPSLTVPRPRAGEGRERRYRGIALYDWRQQ